MNPWWCFFHDVAPTPISLLSSAITILETANEFAIKGNHLTLVKGNQFDGRTKTDPHKHIHEFLRICDMFKYRDTENEVVRLMMKCLRNCHGHESVQEATLIKIRSILTKCKITQEVLNAAAGGIFLYKTPNQAYQLLEDKGTMTQKMELRYKRKPKPMQKTKPDLDEDEIECREEEAKFMQTFRKTRFYNDYRYRGLRIAIIGVQHERTENMLVEVGKFTFPADFVILEMEEDSSKILHSIEGTLLEEEIFAEFDEFMAMTADENSDSESDTEDPPFEKITINTDYKIKTSLEEPPTDLELKPLPDNLEYDSPEEPSFLPVIISSSAIQKKRKNKHVYVLKSTKQPLLWKTTIFLYLPIILQTQDTTSG
ncbi:hypothetical protein Tco_1017716 [Tanacetum coccineum]|uniref:Reverse transcriptase domain-containing protein n=1 Tax=Tanacetum coccineum TaxID=301880 RepID=A0ABQ5FS95_9ASTR